MLASSYSNRRWIRLSTIGQRAIGNSKFFERLKQGRVTIRNAERLAEWLSENWPGDLDWPPGVERPEPARTEKAS